MRNKCIILILWIVFILTGYSWGEALFGFMISDTKISSSVSEGVGKLFISSRISHPKGHQYIDRLAATIFHGTKVTTLPRLYDDATHGDTISGDGIFSLNVSAPAASGHCKIVVYAVDKERNEIESEPVIFTVE